jgi:hypothetical protein
LRIIGSEGEFLYIARRVENATNIVQAALGRPMRQEDVHRRFQLLSDIADGPNGIFPGPLMAFFPAP